tara:strand:+ start:397 stop:651 length:255 start_codon:yes stop_codon:yes gene_type:complete
MMEKEEFEFIRENDELPTWDGYDEAIIGLGYRCGMGDVVIYDRDKMVEISIEMGMTFSEADEWISYNIEGAYIGEKTPIIMNRL